MTVCDNLIVMWRGLSPYSRVLLKRRGPGGGGLSRGSRAAAPGVGGRPGTKRAAAGEGALQTDRQTSRLGFELQSNSLRGIFSRTNGKDRAGVFSPLLKYTSNYYHEHLCPQQFYRSRENCLSQATLSNDILRSGEKKKNTRFFLSFF